MYCSDLLPIQCEGEFGCTAAPDPPVILVPRSFVQLVLHHDKRWNPKWKIILSPLTILRHAQDRTQDNVGSGCFFAIMHQIFVDRVLVTQLIKQCAVQ